MVLLLALCGISLGQEEKKPDEDVLSVTSRIVATLSEIEASLKPILNRAAAEGSRDRLARLVESLNALDKKRETLGTPLLEASDAEKLVKLEGEGLLATARIRDQVTRIAADPTLADALGEVMASLKKLFLKEKDAPNGRNPFEPSSKMIERIFNSQNYPGARGSGRSRSTALPQITMKGYVEDTRGIRIALIELKGVGTILVREKDQLTLDPDSVLGGMEIIRIEPQGVSVKMGGSPSVRIFR